MVLAFIGTNNAVSFREEAISSSRMGFRAGIHAMYERPEDISLKITSIATPIGVAAVAARTGQGSSPPDVVRIFTECGSAVDEQFGVIHDQVDEHSGADHTELLRIKINLLRLAVQTTVELLRVLPLPTTDDAALLNAVIELLEQCVTAACEQYANCQERYLVRSAARRMTVPGGRLL